MVVLPEVLGAWAGRFAANRCLHRHLSRLGEGSGGHVRQGRFRRGQARHDVMRLSGECANPLGAEPGPRLSRSAFADLQVHASTP